MILLFFWEATLAILLRAGRGREVGSAGCRRSCDWAASGISDAFPMQPRQTEYSDHLGGIKGFCEDVVSASVECFRPEVVIRKSRGDDDERRIREFPCVRQYFPPRPGQQFALGEND